MSRSPTATARDRLFVLYSRQLELGGVTPTDIFVCPLCRAGFTRHALAGPSPALSLAHIVPDALGGTDCTLTCTACNNGNGARFEADLANRFRYEDWGSGRGEWPARLSGSFGDVGIKFSRTAEASRWALEVVHDQTNPASLAALEEWLRSRREGKAADTKWNVSWKLRSRRRAVDAAIYQLDIVAVGVEKEACEPSGECPHALGPKLGVELCEQHLDDSFGVNEQAHQGRVKPLPQGAPVLVVREDEVEAQRFGRTLLGRRDEVDGLVPRRLVPELCVLVVPDVVDELRVNPVLQVVWAIARLMMSSFLSLLTLVASIATPPSRNRRMNSARSASIHSR